jgi:hypothetical protein
MEHYCSFGHQYNFSQTTMILGNSKLLEKFPHNAQQRYPVPSDVFHFVGAPNCSPLHHEPRSNCNVSKGC